MNNLLIELNKIKDWINENPVIVKRKNADGRIDSLLSEGGIVEILCKQFPNITSKKNNRAFGDFKIEASNGDVYPVNLKLTSEDNKSNDNLVGMVGIMSHIFFGGKKSSSHSAIAKKLRNGEIEDSNNDYGFLSITKETGISKTSTMLAMEGYVVNPSNGFQANFNKIETIEDKTCSDGRDYMLKKYKEYLKKKAEAYLILDGVL